MNTKGTVFLVDDDEALRRATTRLLTACGYTVKAYGSAEEYLAALDPKATGCILLDLRMPGLSGLELQKMLVARKVALPIVFLTGHADVSTSVLGMKQGAIDFLQKPVREEDLLAALDRALQVEHESRDEKQEVAQLQARYDTLTPREREVLTEMVAGLRNKQTAFTLGIAERTVKLHRSRVLDKMGAPTLPDLVRMAEKLGLGPKSG